MAGIRSLKQHAPRLIGISTNIFRRCLLFPSDLEHFIEMYFNDLKHSTAWVFINISHTKKCAVHIFTDLGTNHVLSLKLWKQMSFERFDEC